MNIRKSGSSIFQLLFPCIFILTGLTAVLTNGCDISTADSTTEEAEEDSDPIPSPPPPPPRAESTIGEEGGSVQLHGSDEGDEGEAEIVLKIPMGAIDREDGRLETISITRSAIESLPGYVISSRIFEFGPEGLDFATPVEIQIRYNGNASNRTLFWSTRDKSGFEPVASRFEGNLAFAKVSHFSILLDWKC